MLKAVPKLLALWATLILFLFALLRTPDSVHLAENQQLAARLLLTDLCLTTESRHTRHISMPEWMAPFQDLPGWHDHFPSSSFMWPPKQRAAYFPPVRQIQNPDSLQGGSSGISPTSLPALP